MPADVAGCTWGSASLAGNIPFENAERTLSGDGYLVHDRDDALYRLLVVEHSSTRITWAP